jgi:hypothetical protein
MRVTKRGTDNVPFFVDYKEVTNEVDMDGVNIQYHKIGKIVPDCSRYFLILYLL